MQLAFFIAPILAHVKDVVCPTTHKLISNFWSLCNKQGEVSQTDMYSKLMTMNKCDRGVADDIDWSEQASILVPLEAISENQLNAISLIDSDVLVGVVEDDGVVDSHNIRNWVSPMCLQ